MKSNTYAIDQDSDGVNFVPLNLNERKFFLFREKLDIHVIRSRLISDIYKSAIIFL